MRIKTEEEEQKEGTRRRWQIRHLCQSSRKRFVSISAKAQRLLQKLPVNLSLQEYQGAGRQEGLLCCVLCAHSLQQSFQALFQYLAKSNSPVRPACSVKLQCRVPCPHTYKHLHFFLVTAVLISLSHSVSILHWTHTNCNTGCDQLLFLFFFSS